MGTPEEIEQRQHQAGKVTVRIPSYQEVLEKSQARTLPSLFCSSSSSNNNNPPASVSSFSEAFSFVKNTEFYTPPPPPPQSSSNEQGTASNASGVVSLSRKIAPATVTQGRNAIIVSRRQQGNRMLKHIRNVRWTFGDIVPDYLLGQNTCALYLSLRYHLLHPDYLYYRIRELQKCFKLRVVLCHVDVEDVIKPLHEVTRTALLHDCTLLCGWSVEECARYLETIKIYENKPADIIQERTDNDYLSRLSSTLTTVRHVNKSDVVSLGSTFGTLSGIMGASMEELARCPGIGERKVKRLYDTFHEPFRRVMKYSGTASGAEVSTQDKEENTKTNETTESRRHKIDNVEVEHPEVSLRSALGVAYAKYGNKIGVQKNDHTEIGEAIQEGATSEMSLEGDMTKERID
jgi:DNA excision repair protein ERCC-1